MSDEPRPDKGIESIIAGAARADQEALPHTSDDVAALAERVDLLVADFGKWEEYKAASAEYVREFSTEIKWIRITRVWVASICAALLLVLIGGLAIVLFFSRLVFSSDQGHALTALIVSTIGGSVIIAITTVRGVFGTTIQRNESLPMPEHLKAVVDAAGGLFGKG